MILRGGQGAGRSLAVPRDRRGLTLIEVLLALTIFLLSFVAIARLIDMGGDRELDARMYNTAARLAQGKLAEVESGFAGLDETGGSFDGSDETWQWSMTAEAQDVPNLYLVTVTVSRDYKGKTFTYNLAQMLIDPAVKGAAAEAARPDPTGESP